MLQHDHIVSFDHMNDLKARRLYVGSHRRCRLDDVLTLKAKKETVDAALARFTKRSRRWRVAPAPKPDVVVADANVLFSNDQRNVLMTLADERIIELEWTDQIEAEWVKNLVEKRNDDPQKLARTAGLMRKAIPATTSPTTGHTSRCSS
jgi:hypothetical protein